MANYDFTTSLSRTSSGSAKWDEMCDLLGDKSNIDGIVPFTTADMEFRNPPELITALQSYIGAYPLGYSKPYPQYYSAIKQWLERVHNFEVDESWIVGCNGVVAALFAAVKAFSKPNDGVILMPPVYYPFFYATEWHNRKLEVCSLKRVNDKYEIDFDLFEEIAKKQENKIVIFCSPHNPVGRVWTKDELSRFGEICLKNSLTIVSDEVHSDLIMPNFKHIPMLQLSEEIANITVQCYSIGKTFNLAGLQSASIIIKNKELRDKFSFESSKQGFHVMGPLAYKATEVVYTKCDAWYKEMLEVIYQNHLAVSSYLKENIPIVNALPMEGTYLQWLDFSSLNIGGKELESLLREEALLFMDSGYIFGDGGEMFQRMNLACPQQLLLDALERLKALLLKKGFMK